MNISVSDKIRLTSKLTGVPLTKVAHETGQTYQNLMRHLKNSDGITVKFMNSVADSMGAEVRVVFVLPNGEEL